MSENTHVLTHSEVFSCMNSDLAAPHSSHSALIPYPLDLDLLWVLGWVISRNDFAGLLKWVFQGYLVVVLG